MQLGLGHTLSRYKLKFSPDKVDVMIVQVRSVCVCVLSSLAGDRACVRSRKVTSPFFDSAVARH